MKKLRIILILTSIVVASVVSAQNKKLYVDTEVGFMYGLVEKSDLYKLNQGDAHINAYTLRLLAYYPTSDKAEFGIGAGLARYTGTDDNTFALLASSKYRPLNRIPEAFIVLTCGYNIDGGDFTPGYVSDLGVGYDFKIGNRIKPHVSFGYNFTRFKREDPYGTGEKFKSNRHSLYLRLGISF